MNSLYSTISWLLLIIALAGDFIVAYVLAVFYPGYSHKRQVMSVLGNPDSPVAKKYSSWLILLGVLLCLSSVNVYFEYSRLSKLYAALMLVIICLFGIGAGILAGLFSVDEEKNIESTASKIHGIGADLDFVH